MKAERTVLSALQKGWGSAAFRRPWLFILLIMSKVLSRFSVISVSPSGHTSLPIETCVWV